ncbi:MAG: hypothetical protein E7252_05255 [Lachnospira sp.]|nr:hypothetical protein [Lachnospira sp.]
MYLAEFDEKKWEAIIREEEREEGIEIGREEIILGILEDYTPEQTAILLKKPLSYILQVANGKSKIT